jgi:hypothetical protein
MARLQALSEGLHESAAALAEDISHRYFTLPGGADLAQRI